MTLDEILDSVITEPNCGCWIWAGTWDRNGYGMVIVDGKRKAAYRTVYEALKGEIPPKLQLDHLCRVKCCVNPDHLEPVTVKENFRRKREIGGSARTIDVVDVGRELQYSAHAHMVRIERGFRTVRKAWSGYDVATLQKLNRMLRSIDVEYFEYDALIDLRMGSYVRGKSEPITSDDALSLLDFMARLAESVKERAALSKGDEK